MTRAPTPRVAYVMSRFPKLTETFILYEIVQMRRLGVAVDVYPLVRHRERVAHAEASEIAAGAHYLPVFSWSILLAHLHFILNRPRRYFGALAEILGGTFGSRKFFLGAVGLFPKTVRFAYEMRGAGITHVHAQFAHHPAVAALLIHRLTGIPFSFTARGSDIHVDRRMLARKLEAAAFAIAVSSFNRQVMIDECGPGVAEKIHVIYGGVDVDRLRPGPAAAGGETLRIICVARFEPVKGHADLVDACGILRDRGVPFECRMVGDGELQPAIRGRIDAAGLQALVTLEGPRAYDEVIGLLSEASVAVLATAPAPDGKREGIPNVLKEAMAFGLPVVATGVSGIPELVEHDHTGLLVPPRDAAALADALQRLQAEPAFRERLGRNGRGKVVRDFDLRKSTARRAALFTGAGTGAATHRRAGTGGSRGTDAPASAAARPGAGTAPAPPASSCGS